MSTPSTRRLMNSVTMRWFSPGELLPFLPGGLLGAWAGAALLPRLNTAWVKAAFGLLLLWASWRLLLGG